MLFRNGRIEALGGYYPDEGNRPSETTCCSPNALTIVKQASKPWINGLENSRSPLMTTACW